MAGSPPPGGPQQGGQGYQQQPQGYPQQGPGGPPQHDPNAPYGVDPATGIPYSEKQKMVAALLQIVVAMFGFGGIGRMYMGQVGLGITQLIVGWVTCGIGLWWSIIEGILILTDKSGNYTDGDGRPLRPN